MAIGSGLGGSLGAGREGTYATYQAPDHFWKATKASIKEVPRYAQGGGFAAGQLSQDASRRVVTGQAATGDIEMEVATKNLGLILQDVMGSSAVPAQ